MKNLNRFALGIACATLSVVSFADPPENGPASCQAYEATFVSPPGTQDGTFSRFGMPGILAFIDTVVAASPFINRGDVIAFFSQLHAGSHEACDEAAGVPPDAE